MKNKIISVSCKSLLVLILLISTSCASLRQDKALSGYVKVIRVVDGDTFVLDDGSEKGVKVRLIGVDTPETKHPKKAVQYYGEEASAYTKSVLLGNKVKLKYDVDRYDRYGRILAYVYLKDGTFFNADLIKKGYAHVMTVPPNVKYAEQFLKLERKARTRKVGLWK